MDFNFHNILKSKNVKLQWSIIIVGILFVLSTKNLIVPNGHNISDWKKLFQQSNNWKKPDQSSSILWSYGWTSKILKFYNVSGNSHCLLYLQNT